MTTNETPETPILWTVALYGAGEEIIDLATAKLAVETIFGTDVLTVEDDGAGGWLVELPPAIAAELQEDGWISLESLNWELQAEMP